jgi:EAL domain-containing protein (putative c-di-GMP-specific phosphodiesterase class I)
VPKSSLSYLGDLPVQTLKIDRSFTHRITDSERMAGLVRGIVQIADTLGLQTVAEGVETVRQRDMLRDMGCTYGQGFLFAEPLTADEATALLAGGGVLDP